jgi:hypothetical protein
MSYLLLIAFTASAVAVFRLKQRKAALESLPRSMPSATAENDFACVELRCGRGSCHAARRIRGTSQLACDAPVLPLPGCDKGVCSCRYVKTDDRRQSEGRRLVDLGVRPLVFDGSDQRESLGDRRV